MTEYDAIVIGAGLGGLTAGAKLAKDGKKILMIEQHNKVGGCATTFRRKNTTFEVSLHEMDGLDTLDPKREIFHDLGVFSNLEFVRVPEFYRFINGRVDLEVPSNAAEAVAAISKVFPTEKNTIKTIINEFTAIHKQIARWNWPKWKKIISAPVFPFLVRKLIRYTAKRTTVSDYLDHLTSNEDLKLALSANIGYYSDNPQTMSLLFFGAAQGSYIQGGGHYIKGGSQVLSDHLAKVITDNEGDVLLNQLVTEILIQEDTAIGVKYRPTQRKDSEELQVFANVIIANAAIPDVVNSLVPALQNTEYHTHVNSLEKSCSLLTIYLAFSKPVSSLGHTHYSTIVFDEDLKTLADFYPLERSHNYSKKGFIFVNYNAIDSQLTEEGTYVGAITTIDYIDSWNALSKEEYQAKKKEVAQIYIDRLDFIIPGIKQIISFKDVATPMTLERYTLNPEGSVYGFAQTSDQVGPKIEKASRVPIKNLYFASAWSGIGGFSGAIGWGYSCALKVLERHE